MESLPRNIRFFFYFVYKEIVIFLFLFEINVSDIYKFMQDGSLHGAKDEKSLRTVDVPQYSINQHLLSVSEPSFYVTLTLCVWVQHDVSGCSVMKHHAMVVVANLD